MAWAKSARKHPDPSLLMPFVFIGYLFRPLAAVRRISDARAAQNSDLPVRGK